MNREQLLSWLVLEGYLIGYVKGDGYVHEVMKRVHDRRSITALKGGRVDRGFDGKYAVGSPVDLSFVEGEVSPEFTDLLMRKYMEGRL